jgi:membrane protein
MKGIHYKTWLRILKATYTKWWDDDPFRQSAAIAYYALFSLPALLVIIVDLAGIFFCDAAVSGKIADAISGAMGADTALQVQDMIAVASRHRHSVIASAVGVITILVGATGVFTELQKSLNYIWEVKPKERQVFIKFLRNKLFSFGLIISIGFMLLVSLVLTSLITAFGDWISSHFISIPTYVLHLVNELFSLTFITLLFGLMYKYLPDADTKWRSIWPGAILTSFLFIIGKYALGLYFGKFQPTSTYGTAGSVILILLWASYSCMILFFGAEFTKQYAKHQGDIEPRGNAEKVIGPQNPITVKPE